MSVVELENAAQYTVESKGSRSSVSRCICFREARVSVDSAAAEAIVGFRVLSTITRCRLPHGLWAARLTRNFCKALSKAPLDSRVVSVSCAAFARPALTR